MQEIRKNLSFFIKKELINSNVITIKNDIINQKYMSFLIIEKQLVTAHANVTRTIKIIFRTICLAFFFFFMYMPTQLNIVKLFTNNFLCVKITWEFNFGTSFRIKKCNQDIWK